MPAGLATGTAYIEAALADRATGSALPLVVTDLSRRRIVGAGRHPALAYWN